MVLRRLLLPVLYFAFLTTPYFTLAQREAAFWYFGYHAGLDFNEGNPVALQDGVMKLDGGCAVISDKDSGDLLFYTDGRNFWNNQHELMPGSNFPDKCWTLVTQPAVIVPDSQNKYLFNVFCLRFPEEIEGVIEDGCIYSTNTEFFPQMHLYYYLIDMRLDNGKGGIVLDRSNLLIRTDVMEKLTAIPHTNGKDYWVMVHGWNNNLFYAYPLSSTIFGDPVITSIGSVHSKFGTRGYMKSSPNGKRIACAVFDETKPLKPFEIFDFDAATGSVTNCINLGNLRDQYGLSFSPDNSKLYLSTDSPPDDQLKYIIMQYDLEAGDSADIASSGMSVILNNPYTNIPDHGIFVGFSSDKKGLQLGLDGRLYVMSYNSYAATPESGILVVIDQPNKKGFDCQINYKRFDFGEGRTGIGFPNFIQSYFNNLESITVCDQPSSIGFYPNPTTGKINIEVLQDCPQTYSLEVVNALGQLIFSQTSDHTPTDIDISFLANGLYFIRVRTPGNVIVVKKIIKV